MSNRWCIRAQIVSKKLVFTTLIMFIISYHYFCNGMYKFCLKLHETLKTPENQSPQNATVINTLLSGTFVCYWNLKHSNFLGIMCNYTFQ